MPDDDALPPPIAIGSQVRDQVVYLAVPLRRAGGVDVAPRQTSLARHAVRELQARDVTSSGTDASLLEVRCARAFCWRAK